MAELMAAIGNPDTGSASDACRDVELGRFGGTTKDRTWLSVAGPTPCVALRSIHIGVLAESPAAAVREIRVLGTVAP